MDSVGQKVSFHTVSFNQSDSSEFNNFRWKLPVPVCIFHLQHDLGTWVGLSDLFSLTRDVICPFHPQMQPDPLNSSSTLYFVQDYSISLSSVTSCFDWNIHGVWAVNTFSSIPYTPNPFGAIWQRLINLETWANQSPIKVPDDTYSDEGKYTLCLIYCSIYVCWGFYGAMNVDPKISCVSML